MENNLELKKDPKEKLNISFTPLRPTFLDNARQRLSVFWPAPTRTEPTIEICETTPLQPIQEEVTSEPDKSCCSCTII